MFAGLIPIVSGGLEHGWYLHVGPSHRTKVSLQQSVGKRGLSRLILRFARAITRYAVKRTAAEVLSEHKRQLDKAQTSRGQSLKDEDEEQITETFRKGALARGTSS